MEHLAVASAPPDAAHAHRDWFVESGARRLANASDICYTEYAHRARERRALPESFEEDYTQIQLDLDRIRPSLREFLLNDDGNKQEGSSGGEEEDEESSEYVALVATLRNVLMAYSVRNARVGYVQGHADLLCFVLAHTPTNRSEEQAFWIYATIIERIFPDDFFARSPKLHGFHVDVKVLEELLAKRLVPHVPQLAKVDLAFVSSLLACKWFIPVWVGELPHSLLVDVWDAMLCDDDGTYLHLLLALHLVRLACDALVALGDSANWEASYVYKQVLTACRSLSPSTTLASIRLHARAVYNLSDEAIEDWRATLRGQPPFLASETRALLQTVHFQPLEIARFHGEFMFARTYLKKCERLRLRGLRREFVDGLLARAFPMIPAELARRIVDLLRRDAYGNISFFRLMQLLSVLVHGSAEERAMLLFSVADKRHCLCLDRSNMEDLADLLCSLAVQHTLTTAGVGVNDEWPLDLNHRQQQPEHSPLLRAHFQSVVNRMCDTQANNSLHHAAWLQGVKDSSDIRAVLHTWDAQATDNWNRNPSRSRSGSSSSSSCTSNSTRIGSVRVEGRSPSSSTSPSMVSHPLSNTSNRTEDKPSPSPQATTFSLLAGRMLKKYSKRCKPPTHQHTGTITTSDYRNATMLEHATLDAALSVSNRVFWCECVIS